MAPEVPPATGGLGQSVKAQPGQGKEGQQPTLGSESGASSLPASHGGRRRPGGGVAASQERQDWTSRAFKSVWFPSRSCKQSLQGERQQPEGETALWRAGYGPARQLTP